MLRTELIWVPVEDGSWELECEQLEDRKVPELKRCYPEFLGTTGTLKNLVILRLCCYFSQTQKRSGNQRDGGGNGTPPYHV
jgi:hypothetical protein